MDADDLRDLFAPFGPIDVRRLFGGLGLFSDGMMFGLVAGGEIYLKADAESVGLFEAVGSRPFTYARKSGLASVSYWRLPDAALDDGEELLRWARVGHGAAERARNRTTARSKPRRAGVRS